MRTSMNGRQRSVAVAALGAAGLVGSALSLSAPTGAEPPVPPNVWIQCSSFSGPNNTFPHPLAGCIARGELSAGKGYTSRTEPGTETIYFTAPFLNGTSLQLTNITNGAPADGSRSLLVDREGGSGRQDEVGGVSANGRRHR